MLAAVVVDWGKLKIDMKAIRVRIHFVTEPTVGRHKMPGRFSFKGRLAMQFILNNGTVHNKYF